MIWNQRIATWESEIPVVTRIVSCPQGESKGFYETEEGGVGQLNDYDKRGKPLVGTNMLSYFCLYIDQLFYWC